MNTITNKNAFQWDAYRPLVDRIPACTAQEGEYPKMHWVGRGYVYPNMHWAGGVCAVGVSSQGVSSAWGVSVQGVYLRTGVSAQGGGGDVCLGGMSTKWGVYLGGVCIPACNEADTPPLHGQTDTCENEVNLQLFIDTLVISCISLICCYHLYSTFKTNRSIVMDSVAR